MGRLKEAVAERARSVTRTISAFQQGSERRIAPITTVSAHDSASDLSVALDLVRAELELQETGRTAIPAGPLDPNNSGRLLEPEDLPVVTANIDLLSKRIPRL